MRLWLHGSYARFVGGDREDVPNDIDVLVVGTIEVGLAYEAARSAGAGLGSTWTPWCCEPRSGME